MPDPYFDIVIVTDPRFQGGTASAVAAEMKAATQAGYSVAFVSYEAINLHQPLPFNSRIKTLIDQGEVTALPPGQRVSCNLAVLHNPYVAGLVPLEPVGVTANRKIVVVHHPPVDALGLPAYDLNQTMRNAEEIFAGPAEWAAVGPNARQAFEALPNAPQLLDTDWSNVIDLDAWMNVPKNRAGDQIRIGRHSRADLRKFPASRGELITIYGTDPSIEVDFLGCPPELRAIMAPVPTGWRIRPFGSVPVREYLDGLDVFVYYHRSDWIEAFGYTVLEAMARGIPCVLPATLAPSFGGAARIEPPEAALDAARELAHAPQETRETAFDFVEQHHSFNSVAGRLNDLIGAPAMQQTPVQLPATEPASVLLISTNGVGMGHLTRTIAIARRIQEPFKPVLVTMSHGGDVAKEFGLHVEFIPYHRYLGVDSTSWNAALREEIVALIDAFAARVVLFDGNSPFAGLIDALALRPNVWSIWSRRGMWQPGSGMEFIQRERHFDAVLEPRDLAADFDIGPTPLNRDLTRVVDPVRLLDDQELLPRELARHELGLAKGEVAILVQLGGGNNFDMQLSRDLALRRLAGRKGIRVVLVDWKISDAQTSVVLPPGVSRLSTYPISRYLKAFDATVAAAGYNSFHEAMNIGLPAIYVPNENPSQDDQLARAQFAARRGAALVARRNCPEALVAALETILNRETRQQMHRAAISLRSPNGAIEAAGIIDQLGRTHRGARN